MTSATNSPAENDTMEDRTKVIPTASAVLRPPSLTMQRKKGEAIDQIPDLEPDMQAGIMQRSLRVRLVMIQFRYDTEEVCAGYWGHAFQSTAKSPHGSDS